MKQEPIFPGWLSSAVWLLVKAFGIVVWAVAIWSFYPVDSTGVIILAAIEAFDFVIPLVSIVLGLSVTMFILWLLTKVIRSI